MQNAKKPKTANAQNAPANAQNGLLDQINALALDREGTTHGERIYRADFSQLTDREKKRARSKIRTKFERLRFDIFMELKKTQKISPESKSRICAFFKDTFINPTPDHIDQVSIARTGSKRDDIALFLAVCKEYKVFS